MGGPLRGVTWRAHCGWLVAATDRIGATERMSRFQPYKRPKERRKKDGGGSMSPCACHGIAGCHEREMTPARQAEAGSASGTVASHINSGWCRGRKGRGGEGRGGGTAASSAPARQKSCRPRDFGLTEAARTDRALGALTARSNSRPLPWARVNSARLPCHASRGELIMPPAAVC